MRTLPPARSRENVGKLVQSQELGVQFRDWRNRVSWEFYRFRCTLCTSDLAIPQFHLDSEVTFYCNQYGT